MIVSCAGEGVFWYFFFFFNGAATTEIYTLSLHDALPILPVRVHKLMHFAHLFPLGYQDEPRVVGVVHEQEAAELEAPQDRKSTRLNSSHMSISYAVFCLKKKKRKSQEIIIQQ